MRQEEYFLLKKIDGKDDFKYVKDIGRSDVFVQNILNATRFTKIEVISIVSKRPDLSVVQETRTYKDVVIKITIESQGDIRLKNEDEEK